ncbi:MAG: DUF4041 domain-containing protein [Methanobrevibacter smithii]
MNIKENKGLIISIIGILLTISIYGIFFGIPLTIIGIYYLNKKAKGNDIDEKLKEKQEELDNIDEKLKVLEQEKEKEIDDKLNEKQEELKNLDEEYQKKEETKEKELNKKLKKKQEELDNIDKTYEKIAKDKEKEIDVKLNDKTNELNNLVIKINNNTRELNEIRKEIALVEETLDMQEYGLYEPKYNFINSTAYKERLDAVRKQQKQMIKDKTAAVGTMEWSINGDTRQGKAFINANIKQILRSFNNETEVIINKVKHSNIESSKKRIQKSFDQLNRLYEREYVSLTKSYLNLKVDEMNIAYEYEVKKQEEKELLREEREREREEKKLQKKLEKEKNKFNRENDKLQKEINKVRDELTTAADKEKAKLEKEIKELKEALNRNNEEIGKIDEWRETPGAGYVYIISNIGSFGKNVFKIGVTRRDNPEERIRELSSASVPFRYDTHVFIFSKDAFALEKELHDRFNNERVNKVNRRKEFFNITIDDVKQIVEENKADVHSFVEHPDAEEYYDTLKIEKQLA